MKTARFFIPLILLIPLVSARADTVRIYSWEDYFSPAVLEAFEAETGHQVELSYYDDLDVREATITSERVNSFELIMVDAGSLRIYQKLNKFADLTGIAKPYYQHFVPRLAKDCGNSLPYSWGTMGVMYRSSVAKAPITSWRQLFEPPAEHHGRVVMFMDNIDTTAAALFALEKPPFSENTADLKLAFQLMKKQTAILLDQRYGISYAKEKGAASQMSLTFGYSGDSWTVAEATGQEDWVYVIPEEGTLLWTECLTVPVDRPVTEATKLFLSFINRPDIAAQNAEETYFATPLKSALALTSEDYRQDQMLFPAEELISKSSFYEIISPASLSLRSRLLFSLTY